MSKRITRSASQALPSSSPTKSLERLTDLKLESPPKKVKVHSGPTIPSNFDDVYAAIQQYRKTHTAPVDTIGCGWLADRELAGPEFRFQTLTALLLSSQTTDERNAAAIERLKALPDGLNPPSIIATETQTLEDILRGVSFHKRKAVYLKETAKMVLDKFEGDVPNTLEGLLEFPGVGPKMAYLALQCCWDISVGIGVDTHVHRIANKLGWVSTKKTEPESTRKELEDWLPKKYWAEINPLLVGFGQTCCTAVKPHCDSCPVADYCPKKSFKK